MMKRKEMSLQEMESKLEDSLESIGITGKVQVEERGAEYIIKVEGYENFKAYYTPMNYFLLELVNTDRKNAYGSIMRYMETFFLSSEDFRPLKYGIYHYPLVQMLDIETGEYEYSTGRKMFKNVQTPILQSDFKEFKFNPCYI